MVKIKPKTLMLILLSLLCALILGIQQVTSHASQHRVYDLSEWQGRLTAKTVKRLKQEVPFVILRTQYGTSHTDYTFKHNQALLRKYKLPYGVYSFSLYHNHISARQEAQDLYHRAPHANFYVNDFEATTLSSNRANYATKVWSKTLRRLVGNRKIIFYSYQDFMSRYANKALKYYNGYWVASYTKQQPTTKHVMWQYTDHFYSPALNQRVDASKLKRNKQWFIGKKKHKKAHSVTSVASHNNTSNNQPATKVININTRVQNHSNAQKKHKNHIRKHHGRKVVKKHQTKYNYKKMTKHAKHHIKKRVRKHVHRQNV